ncbi:MAG: hypothetical protein ABIQ18_13335 [Umezawaea sp.]
MRKRLMLVVGTIVLGGMGLAVPAIAGAMSGNGPATSPSVSTPISDPPSTKPVNGDSATYPVDETPSTGPVAVKR